MNGARIIQNTNIAMSMTPLAMIAPYAFIGHEVVARFGGYRSAIFTPGTCLNSLTDFGDRAINQLLFVSLIWGVSLLPRLFMWDRSTLRLLFNYAVGVSVFWELGSRGVGGIMCWF